jgi:hypothetical protein
MSFAAYVYEGSERRGGTVNLEIAGLNSATHESSIEEHAGDFVSEGARPSALLDS